MHQTLLLTYLVGDPEAIPDITLKYAKCLTPGAAALDGKALTRIEVHGKYLFYFFGDPIDPVILHFHFGMSGAFKTMTLPGPAPTATTRLQLINEKMELVAHLSAMTVLHGNEGAVNHMQISVARFLGVTKAKFQHYA